ncbi:MAG TPA: secondary thiamine-phosphate synthase enzyme YjbQ [Chitinophagaceae bacterium]|nr:secondary thiamine-phosphate synthase enzyme YjbQ [Chitinophagaceae bacterium]
MKIFQEQVRLRERKRGFHVVTSEIVDSVKQIGQLKTGVCQVFVQHTSASVTINEDVSPAVRKDFETFFNKTVPENGPDYEHDVEGPDDMPAHLKSSLLGTSVMIPIRNGQLALGQWQGIYLCEHRDRGGSRNVVVTVMGE